MLDLLLGRSSSLSALQQLRLFGLFKCLLRDNAALIPGVLHVPVTREHFILYQFSSHLLRRYNGFEFVVFDARSSVYYRMPGAMAGGNGMVEQGCHRLCVQHWNLRTPLYLHLQRTPSHLQIAALSDVAEPGATFLRIDGCHLSHAKLSIELEAKVHRCLTRQLACPGEPRTLSPLVLQRALEECAALGPRLSALTATYLEYLSGPESLPVEKSS